MEIVKCTECGKEIELLTTKYYKYKTPAGYQCSYTCYDHSCLRAEQKKITNANWKSYVKRCEDMMKSQGKEILNPLDPEKKKRYYA